MIQIQWWQPVMIQIEWWSRSSHDDPIVMIQIEWWSRSSDDSQWWSKSNDDVPWWSRSSDDPEPVMMLHDDPDREMIHIQWRWLIDKDDLNMKMNWRCRWREDPEKKTSDEKNTFLVKRECWCNCNFRMYSLVFLIFCNPMFISGCYYVM